MRPLIPRTGLLLLLFPIMALAHTDVGQTTGFAYGFGHPFSGADHMLAMVAVGLWASLVGGRAVWVVPSTFLAVMIIGGFLGFSGISVPFIEEGILVSVLVLGVMIAGAFKLKPTYGAIIVGIFAIFHGHAHGAELPAAIGAASYTISFALATAALHLAGIGLGLLLKQINLPAIDRIAGSAIILGGIYLTIS